MGIRNSRTTSDRGKRSRGEKGRKEKVLTALVRHSIPPQLCDLCKSLDLSEP